MLCPIQARACERVPVQVQKFNAEAHHHGAVFGKVEVVGGTCGVVRETDEQPLTPRT
jgi:hypothetical protein